MAVALCMTVSCRDLLDMPIDGRTNLDNIFADAKGVFGYLNSCYGFCPAPYMDRASMSDEAQDADDMSANSRSAVWYADGLNARNFNSYSSDYSKDN